MKEEQLQERLEEFGLNQKETKIYLLLLRKDSSTANELSKVSGINRTTVYLELEKLLQKGLVNYVIKDSVKRYKASKPQKLVEKLEHKKELAQEIVPFLSDMQTRPDRFSIETYEGKEGIKIFYQDVIQEPGELLVFGATGKGLDVLRYSYPKFMNRFVQAKKVERVLANADSKDNMRKHPHKNFNVRFLPKKYHAEVSTAIYAGKIAIQSLQKDNMYVIIIKDKALHKSYKNYFEFMWEMASKENKT